MHREVRGVMSLLRVGVWVASQEMVVRPLVVGFQEVPGVQAGVPVGRLTQRMDPI